jgi:hypothetical protein
VISLCATISPTQVKREHTPAKKSAMVTYQGEGPSGMYKFGSYYLRFNNEVKLFAWDSDPRTPTRFYNTNKTNAFEKGAVWRIVYSSAIRERDIEEADFHLWSATFTGRVQR